MNRDMTENGYESGDGGGGGLKGGGGINGPLSDPTSATKVCRDFMRNVCQRGKGCRFLHPDNIKIRTDPIFCHDFMTGRCFRSNCKFIHCSREDEEEFKLTGELPAGVVDPEAGPVPVKKSQPSVKNDGGHVPIPICSYSNVRTTNQDFRDPVQVPLCKDFLKGVCDRPPGGCKYRHGSPRPQVTVPLRPAGYGHGRGVARDTREHGPPSVPGFVGGPRRRKIIRNPYDDGPKMKRYHMDEYNSGGYEEEEYEEVEEGGYGPPLPPPPLPRVPNYNYTNYGNYAAPVISRNGYHQQHPPECLPFYQSSSNSDAMKALEDENFMLKRRIEELKSSNEFLLNQNAQLRLNNSLSSGTSVAQVQPLAVTAVSVSGAMPTVQQPSIIGITSSSLSATQPLPTISISTLPTVSSIITPVSISQSLQTQTQSQAQLFIPAPN